MSFFNHRRGGANLGKNYVLVSAARTMHLTLTPETSHNQELIQLIVEEVRSHKELHDLPFTMFKSSTMLFVPLTQMTASPARCP